MRTPVLDEVAELLRASVDAFRPERLARLSGAEAVELVRMAEQHRNQLAAVDAWLLCELGEKSLTGEIGTTAPADVLMSECRVAPGTAKARMKAARDLGPRHSVVGEPLAPIFPLVAAALEQGLISPAHATVIRQAIGRIPPEKAAESAPVAEKLLVTAAQHENPHGVREIADRLLAHLDPDGKKPDERRSWARRNFGLFPAPDGGYDGTLHFTAETAAAWLAILDALAAPQPTKDESGQITIRDERTAGQRRHDGMLEAAERLLRSGSLPATGGTPTTILVRVNLADLRPHFKTDFLTGAGFPPPSASPADRDAVMDVLSGASGGGVAQTQHGGLMSVEMLMRLSCEASIIPVALDDLGGVLAFGRGQRLASAGQRYVLTVRDGGCCFPACDRPASWTEVHHIQEWVNGGLTDIDNLCLLCAYHHRHFEQAGWAVEMFEGRPRWIPPSWLDEDRKPRRNRAHHLDDIIFTRPD